MKGMIFTTAILCIIAAAGCGDMNIDDFDPIFSRQPRVVSVEPADGGVVPASSSVVLEFSESIDPSSVDGATFAVIRADATEKTAPADIAESISDGAVSAVEGHYEFAGEGRAAIFKAMAPYEPGARYKIIATCGILSSEFIPLNQRRGGPPSPFVSEFEVEGVAESGSSSVGGASGSVSSPEGSDGQAGDGNGSQSGSGSSATINRPSFLLINEVLYDAVGEDTNGQVFVELAGEADGEIGGYKILLVGGDNGKVYDTIEITSGKKVGSDGVFVIADAKTGAPTQTQVSGADLVANFDPQNGPDCIQLVDEKGRVLDALGYGTPIIALAENGSACFEGTPAAKATSGKSLSRIDSVDTGDNAIDFQILPAPTPGAT